MNAEIFHKLKELYVKYAECETKLNKSKSLNYRKNYEATMMLIEGDIDDLLHQLKRERVIPQLKREEKREKLSLKDDASKKDTSILTTPSVVTETYKKHEANKT
jgi:hypothetical protein